MEANLKPQNKEESLSSISGWLIVFIVFLVLNLAYSISKCFILFVGLDSAIITLVFTILILIFFFKRNIIFRTLFIVMMALDLAFTLIPLFMIVPIEAVVLYPSVAVLLIISLAKLIIFTVYLFKSERVSNTFESKPTTLSGGTSAFLIFVFSFFVVNLISLFLVLSRTGDYVKELYNGEYLLNIAIHVVPLIFCGIIIKLIKDRSSSFRGFYIAMMLLQTILAFILYEQLEVDVSTIYGLHSYDLPLNIISIGAFALCNLIIWSILIYKSKSIQKDITI